MPYLKDQKELAYPVEKVFHVAMDLESYPDILPYIKAVKVISRTESHVKARLKFGLGLVAFTYDCDIYFRKNKLIEISCRESLFRKFHSKCVFSKGKEGGTHLDYELDAEFSSPMLELVARALLARHANATIKRFEHYLRKL